jgi:hypothetical protein
LFAGSLGKPRAERVAYSIATDRLNLTLDNTSVGTDSNTIVNAASLAVFQKKFDIAGT